MAESVPVRSSSTNATTRPVGGSRLKRLRIAEDPPNHPYAIPTAPPEMQISGSGMGKINFTENKVEAPNGYASGQSPPISRSSSAQDSCSTSATTFEGTDETVRRGRDDTENLPNNKHVKEVKGNVIVSVRVRPDAGGSGDKKSEGEWMVDGRRSLVAYRGREKGEYFYGEFETPYSENVTHGF